MRTLSRINRLLICAALVSGPVFGREQPGNRFQGSTAGEQGVPGDTLITLERTGCYGMCPIYKITISADGSVAFEGERFVKRIGKAKSAISRDELRKLLAKFDEIKFFDLKWRYETISDGCQSEVTDHPSAITSINFQGKSKSVIHYYGCRGVEVLAKLEKLEQAIDEAVNSAQWIR